MKNEQHLSIDKNNSAFAAQLIDASHTLSDISETIVALSAVQTQNNQTLLSLLTEQKNAQQYQMGYTLGIMKAYVDTLPAEVANHQRINGVPLDLLIKLKVDEAVLNQREMIKNVCNFTFETLYWSRYRRLSEAICGYGYNLYFIQERFEQFYPNGMHNFVAGFARGYSSAFHTIATECGIETVTTEPVEQDIWKNYPYFLSHEVHEYRLDGKYLFMYHGGCNFTGKDLPCGNNVQIVNKGVYEKLQSRPVDDFTPCEFTFEF